MKNRKSKLEDFAGSELSGMQKKMIRGGITGPQAGDPPPNGQATNSPTPLQPQP